jgi:hypothetical protein
MQRLGQRIDTQAQRRKVLLLEDLPRMNSAHLILHTNSKLSGILRSTTAFIALKRLTLPPSNRALVSAQANEMIMDEFYTDDR